MAWQSASIWLASSLLVVPLVHVLVQRLDGSRTSAGMSVAVRFCRDPLRSVRLV